MAESLNQHAAALNIVPGYVAGVACAQVDNIIDLLGIGFDGLIEGEGVAIATFPIGRYGQIVIGNRCCHGIPKIGYLK